MANRLTEILKKSISGIRVKPNVGREYDSAFDPDDELSKSLLDNTSNSSVIDNINTFREMSRNRNEQYDAFDEMEKDATISAALKMYADDATQYNLDGNVIWVESEDPNIAEFGNRLIEVLRLNESAWSHIYQLVKYGDLYLETFYDDESSTSKMNSKSISGGFGTAVQYHKLGARIDEYIEAVPNPASIFDLRKRGKVAGFIKIDDVDPEKTNYSRVYSVNLTGTTQQILPSDKYVHIMISAESSRYPETLNIEYKDKNGNDVNESYRVSKGKSMLADTFKSFRELKLMEDSILLNRVTRSPLTRILQVEVGDMSKTQIREKLRQIKRMIEQKNFLDKDSGEFSNMASPGPVDNIVYVPTRDGKGAITSTTLGGDVDPKSLVDIEYYKQKEAGGLGIPLSYLQGHCFRHDTKIQLLNGDTVTIKDMYDNKSLYINKGILSCDIDGKVHPTTIKDIMLTRRNATFIRVTLDSGEYVDVTPDHRFMLRDGTFVEAHDLEIGCSLMPCYRKLCNWNDRQYNGRWQVFDNASNKWLWQYQLVGSYIDGYNKQLQIHHKNKRITDDDLDNLELLSAGDHLMRHLPDAIPLSIEAQRYKRAHMTPEEISELNYKCGSALRGKKLTDNHKLNISEALRGKKKSSLHIKHLSRSMKNIYKDEEKRNKLKEYGLVGSATYVLNCERKREEQGILERTVRCWKCGKIFRKRMSEHDYASYLNKEKFVYCCASHVNNRLNLCMNLLKECNYNFSEYDKRRCSGKLHLGNITSTSHTQDYASNKFFSTKYMKNLVENVLPSYTPEIVNHKVSSIEYLEVIEDAYDIEVASESHTFALACGIFVHNSGDGGGLSSGTALTKLDNRYARAVKRIQTAYCAGIQTLLNIFAIRKGLTDYVNNFKVRMLSPSTIEDADRDEQLDNRIRMTNDMLSIIDNFEGYNDETKREVIEYLVSVFLNKPEITNILSKQEAVSEEGSMDDSDGYDMSSGGGSSISNNFFGGDMSREPDNDFDFDEALPLESTNDEEISSEEPSESSDFGDFEEFA